MDEYERRCYTAQIRAIGTNDPIIEGQAAVYNRLSEDLGGFREMIEPGFFRDVLKNDVRALFNHNGDLVLGRTKSGTLQLEDGPNGLGVRIYPPNTAAGRDVLALIKRHDVTQMSFAFKVKKGGDEWIKERNGSVRRILKAGGAERLFDVSPVTYPAYPATSVMARTLEMASQFQFNTHPLLDHAPLCLVDDLPGDDEDPPVEYMIRQLRNASLEDLGRRIQAPPNRADTLRNRIDLDELESKLKVKPQRQLR